MADDHLFLAVIERELTPDDRAALEQAGVDLGQEASGGIQLRAADEEQARLRLAAALGGREDVQIQPVEP